MMSLEKMGEYSAGNRCNPGNGGRKDFTKSYPKGTCGKDRD